MRRLEYKDLYLEDLIDAGLEEEQAFEYVKAKYGDEILNEIFKILENEKSFGVIS